MYRFKTGLCVVLGLVIALPAFAESWNLEDVSILYALPKAQESVEVLLGTTPFLPWTVYKKHPVGFIDSNGKDQTYDALRVVGVRIDPAELQIRMVWQPVVWDNTVKQFTTEDRAAHTFYQLNKKMFESFMVEWTQTKNRFAQQKQTSLRPLGVHPAFLNPRLNTTFRQALKGIFLHYCNARNLIQYTAMELKSPDSTWWSFGGIKLENSSSEWKPIAIPRLKGVTQDFFNLSSKTDPRSREFVGMRGQLNFPFDNPVELTSVVESYSDPDESKRASFEQSLKFIARFQNPHRSKATTLDCVSCHIAQPLRFWMDSSLPYLRKTNEEEFQNPNPSWFNLKNKKLNSELSWIPRRPSTRQSCQ